MKKTNGITLIALIVTIILMLILASITVTVAINGGLFEYAGNAKDSAEIANEKDIVSEAFIWAESNSKTGRVTVDELQKNIPTDANATVMDNGDTIVVKFNKNDRYYEIETSGKLQGPIELVKDEHAGDISKGGTCDGSASKPFKITCIEDLVAFSIMSNGGNSNLGLVSSDFKNQYVELTRTLDFKSIFSYKDYTTTIYGDLNTDGKVEDIKTELTKTDEGCIGFTPIGNGSKYDTSFQGSFDGKGNEIKKIYINTTSAGLFKVISNATIQNLTVTGEIMGTAYAGGIAAGTLSSSNNTFINCVNYADVTGSGAVGGIVRYRYGRCDNQKL